MARSNAPDREGDLPRLRLIKAADCAIDEGRPYLVKNIIARGDHAILIGQPGAGKSVIAPHLAYAIAQGRTVLGRRVRGARVLYVAAEDGHGMRRRIAALRQRWGDAPDFYLAADGLDLLHPKSESRGALARTVAELAPGLVVIDTVSRAFPGLIENDAGPMGEVVGVVRSITADGARAVITVHHVTKEGGGSPRGHGVLAADADVVLMVEGAGTEARTARLTKNRNGSCDAALSFLIETETLGIDEDGDAITAPVAAETEPDAAAAARGREAALPDTQALLLRELKSIISEGAAQRVSPRPDMLPLLAVDRDLLRTRLIAAGWFAEGVLASTPDGTKLTRDGYKPEHKALTALAKKGFIAFTRHFAWSL